MSNICRICLVLVQDENNSFSINTVEESTGFMPLRDKLALCVPEMVLDMIQDPAICTACSVELQAAYEFKTKCLQTEEKIRRLIQSVGGTVYSMDLSKIATKDSGATAAVPAKEKEPEPQFSGAELSAVAESVENVVEEIQQVEEVVQAEEITEKVVPLHIVVKKEKDPEVCEIEFAEVSDEKAVEEAPTIIIPTQSSAPDPLLNLEAVKPAPIILNRLPTPRKTILVKVDGQTPQFGVIQCNFCEKSFTGLFYLRQHQRRCQQALNNLQEREAIHKIEQVEIPGLIKRKRKLAPKIELPPPPPQSQPVKKPAAKSPRSATRTNLPIKAKNILQKWLYLHRDNPYPTDAEKLYLINQTNLTLVQVENWFINARRRVLQRMISMNKFKKTRMKFEAMDFEEEEAEPFL